MKTSFQELENTRNKLSDAEKLISTQDKLVKDLEEKLQEYSFRARSGQCLVIVMVLIA